MIKFIFNQFAIASVFLISCNNHQTNHEKLKEVKNEIKSTVLNYKVDSVDYSGYIAYDSSNQNKRPVVFVIHEWWGQNEYVRRRAIKLAELGYFAVALDLYGVNKNAKSVEEAAAFSKPFYQNSDLALKNYKEAFSNLKQFAEADTTQIAIIGYCFGGSMALELARMGEHVSGVVSFHGGLAGRKPQKELFKTKVLVCHGADDQFVSKEEVAQFKKEMDSVQADYKFIAYPGATHAFSNPDATEWGKKFNIPIAYNQNADTSSWNEMKIFFQKIFQK